MCFGSLRVHMGSVCFGGLGVHMGSVLYVFWSPGGAYVEGNAEGKVEGNAGGNAEGNAKGNAKGNAEGNAGGICRPLIVGFGSEDFRFFGFFNQ